MESYGFIHALSSSSLILHLQFLKMERAYEHHHTCDLQKLPQTVNGKTKFAAATLEDLRSLFQRIAGWPGRTQKTGEISNSTGAPDTSSSTEKSSIVLRPRRCGDCIQRDPCQAKALARPLGINFLPLYLGASA